MYYSPRKNLEDFVEAKDQEIVELKQKILGSRVTFEEMDIAKSRLTILKTSFIELQKEDHIELKEVLKNSLQAVNDLVKRKNRLQEELDSQQRETKELSCLESELISKQHKANQFLREACTIKDKLIEKREKKQQQIYDLNEEVKLRKKELAMQRDMGNQLNAAKAQLKINISKINLDLCSLSQQNKKLREAVRKEHDQITRLEHESQKNQLKSENLQLRIEKQEKQAQNLQQKIEASQIFMQRFSEDKLVYLKESETANNIQCLLKMCMETNQKKQKEQKECQDQIKELDEKIQQSALRRQELNGELNSKRDNLRELKEKGVELKNILNSIFHQDSSILKIIADKKVYESNQAPKNQLTMITQNLKRDIQDQVGTSDSFFMTTNSNATRSY